LPEKNQIARVFRVMRNNFHSPEEARGCKRDWDAIDFAQDDILGRFGVVNSPPFLSP